MVVWITGLAGSGKTEIGTIVYNYLKTKEKNTILLDGDLFREVLGSTGYSREDRLDIAFKISKLCEYLQKQGINIVCCTISLFDEIHKLNREILKDYHEVFIDVRIEELIKRDKKKLYSGALEGKIKDVVGIDIEYDRPKTPHLVINNNVLNNLEGKAYKIIKYLDDLKSDSKMKPYEFKTKAKTIQYLSQNITKGKILPVLILTHEEYIKDTEKALDNVHAYFKERKLIIRSTCKNEDTLDASNAGMYQSILDIKKDDRNELFTAIGKVFDSYPNGGTGEDVLIQPLLQSIKMSGVAFTCDLDTLAPYYIVNYDITEKSDTVTSGITNSLKTYISYKKSEFRSEDNSIRNLLECLKEIELLMRCSDLDVEFGIDTNDEVFIFQVRPIVKIGKDDLSTLDLDDVLYKSYKKIEKLMTYHPNLLGTRTVFGVMPDWNPAEIIGLRPKKLAISLYKELIMDNIWAYQRNNYGYRNLRSHPLMISFMGIPYIDVRVTFNSYIPMELNESIAEKLMDYYLEKLINTPTHHDKIEFEIVHSCYYLNLPLKLAALKDFGFNENELKRIEFALLELTNRIINPNTGLCKLDIEKNKLLEKKFDRIVKSKLSIVDKIYWLIEDCKRYGTLPFAGVARAAFIAVQFLKSFIELDIITKEEYEVFLNSINSINKQMNFDLLKVSKQEMTKEVFKERYGHIRPGTYDIMSLRYDENFEQYFPIQEGYECKDIKFSFSEKQLKKIDKLLLENGIKVTAEELICFIKEAIEGREYTKFIFTKSLSEVLKLLVELGVRNGLEREELAFLDIQIVKDLYSSLDHRNIKDIFLENINNNKELYQYTKAVKLPSLILRPEDVYGFHLFEEEPNYVTLKKIRANVAIEKSLHIGDLKGKIIMIRSADPGFDFLFSKDIGGLITQFGGANSHMSIRCAELGIPAVIGVGEKNFSYWSSKKSLEIDCLNKQVRCYE